VKTPAEVKRIEAVLAAPRFVDGRMLTVAYRTDPETVARVLPPGFTPPQQPVVRVLFGRWGSNCVGEFAGGNVYVPATYGETHADYVLTMFMDGERPVIFGRETFGEPKKLAQVLLIREGDHVHATVERDGTRLLQADVQLGHDRGPAEFVALNFNVRAILAADGSGLLQDAAVNLVEFDTKVNCRHRRGGEARARWHAARSTRRGAAGPRDRARGLYRGRHE
jgi:acetoacetate decarboxylase